MDIGDDLSGYERMPSGVPQRRRHAQPAGERSEVSNLTKRFGFMDIEGNFALGDFDSVEDAKVYASRHNTTCLGFDAKPDDPTFDPIPYLMKNAKE